MNYNDIVGNLKTGVPASLASLSDLPSFSRALAGSPLIAVTALLTSDCASVIDLLGGTRADAAEPRSKRGLGKFGSMVVTAAAAAAAEEEELRHMGPASRVKHPDDAATEEGLGGDDDEILQFMDSADGYLLLMDSLSSALRQGWLDLASARHSMGASRVSSTLFDHKEQSAATKLQVDYSADLQPSESSPHFSLSKWCLQEESNSSDAVIVQDSTKPKLRHRGSAATPDGSAESDATIAKSSTGVDGSNQVQRARSKALSVFGALVSPKLRTTQVSFETALELIVELANLRSTLLSTFSQIKHESGFSAGV